MKPPPGRMLTVAVALLCASAAIAGEEKAHDPMSGPGTTDKIEAEMRIMDANQDGKVSRDEHAAGAQQMFKSMDANRDMRVTAAEMTANSPLPKDTAKTGEAKSHDSKAHHEMSAAQKIKVVDTDGDGVLTAQEHAAGSKTMFGKMDGDKDGFLTAGEIKAGHKELMMSKDE